MVNKVLALLVVVAVAGVALGSLWLLDPGDADASSHSATRSFSATSVDPGEEITVTILADNYGDLGRIVETVPDGFTTSDGGQTVTIRLLSAGPRTVTYTATATDSAGSYSFSGTIADATKNSRPVVGENSVTITAPPSTPEPTDTPTPDTDPSATRSFSATSVDPGGTVTVTIQANNYGGLGRVVETLPSGFTSPNASGQTVTLRLLQEGPQTRSYTVTASDNPGSYTFSGVLESEDKSEKPVGGSPTVTVNAPPGPSATRSFSATSVDPGGTVTVTIQANNYGGLGRVVETLPSGFTSPDASGQTVTLRLLQEGPQTRSYTVTASDNPGSYTFSGVLESEDKSETPVGGSSTVPVNAPPGPSATRSFSATRVDPGGTVTVTIRANNYGGLGRVVETLPSGFTSPDASGQTVTLRLLQEGPQTRSYSVTASDNLGSYTFSGVLEHEDKSETPVGGSSGVAVRVAAPGPEPEPQGNRAPVFTDGAATTRSIDENSASGANVGDAVRATDADGDTVIYSLTGTDAGSFTINSISGQIMVDTMLDFENKASYTVTVTATDPDNASDSISVTVMVANMDEDGMVTIMPDTTPQVGMELTASLDDPDGNVVNLTWQWQKDDGQGSYTDISGATMMSYTPVMADEDHRLRATAMYDDSFGEDKTAVEMTANAVGATGGIVSRYDTDGTPGISEIEASVAVLDYLIRDKITRDEAIQVVTAYREDPLIVGHLNTVTGSLSYFGPEQNNGVELAALHVNQAGGVLGAQMIIVTGDTATNPDTGVAAARALVDVEGAVAIVGALASSVTLAVAQSVTVPKQRLLISPASTSPAITDLEDDDFLFRTTVSDAAQGVVLAGLAWDNGYETAGIMLINNAYGEGLADQFGETFASLGGRVTGKVPHEDSQPTYTSELEKATEGDPDVLLAISYPGQAEVYLRESLEGGYSATFLFVDGTKSPEMMEVVGWDALEGMLGTAQGSPDSPSLLEFQGSYAAVHGAPPEHPFIAENYDAAVLIALAAAKAGTTTDSVAIRDALRSIANPPGEEVGPGVEGIKKALMLIDEGKDINYEGGAGTVDFDENGDVTGYIEIWKVEGGEIKSIGFELP